MTQTEKVDKLVAHIGRTLGDLSVPLPGAEDEYAALPLCVIDAVFSIGVRYGSTRRTVCDWCARYHWEKDRARAAGEHTISDFLLVLRPYENRWEDMANDVFDNRQRTSTTSGILKAEAVYRFSGTLHRFGVETFADALKFGLSADLRHAIEAIPGQGSGLSFNYFLMLAGHTDAVKGDRMVRRFVACALGVRDVPPRVAEGLVRQASACLRPQFPQLTPSLLDHRIWEYQRRQDQAALGDRRHQTLLCRTAPSGTGPSAN